MDHSPGAKKFEGVCGRLAEGFCEGRSTDMDRKTTGSGGVGKTSGEMLAKPVSQFVFVEFSSGQGHELWQSPPTPCWPNASEVGK